MSSRLAISAVVDRPLPLTEAGEAVIARDAVALRATAVEPGGARLTIEDVTARADMTTGLVATGERTISSSPRWA